MTGAARGVRWVLPAIGLFTVARVAAFAGPPFDTERAAPIGQYQTEIDIFAQSTTIRGSTSATLPGLQIDYGVLPNLQVRLEFPVSFIGTGGQAANYGVGDIEFGAKYRFFEGGDDTWLPQVSFFPVVLVPTGNSRSGLGQGFTTVALPLWLQKDIGPWTVYGGGGYAIEGGSGSRNPVFVGLAAERAITDDLSLGGELFYKGSTAAGQPASATLSLGGSYDFNERYHLYFSVSRSLENVAHTNQFGGYVALALTF